LLSGPMDGKRLVYRDKAIKGFCLRTGARDAVYLVEHRIGGSGVPVKVTIGSAREVDFATAQKTAFQFIATMQGGAHPKDKKVQPKVDKATIPTLAQALEIYIENRAENLKVSSAKTYRAFFSCALADWLELPVTRITESMVEAKRKQLVHKRIVKDKHTNEMREKWVGKAAAKSSFAVLGAVLKFISAKCRDDQGNKLLAANPVDRLTELKLWPKVESREGFIESHELAAVYDKLCSVGGTAAALILFLVLSGCRLSEARKLSWSNVSLLGEKIYITAENSKTGRRRAIPMTCQLRQILQEMTRYKVAGSAYVFPDSELDGPIKEYVVRKAFCAVSDALAKHEQIVLHSLRHSYITHGSALIPYPALQKLVGHKERSMTGAYDHSEGQAAQAQIVADWITVQMTGVKELPLILFATKPPVLQLVANSH